MPQYFVTRTLQILILMKVVMEKEITSHLWLLLMSSLLEDLNLLVQELGEHSDEESMGIVEESDDEEDENVACLQENYNSLLEKSREYARVAKAAMKKMKKAEEDYRSLLMRHKEAKCEIEKLNGELLEAYTKVRFL